MDRQKISDKDYKLLFDACNLGNIKLIKAVCDYSIINHQDENGYTLLSIACMRNDILMIKTLLKFVPDINIKTNDGFSALMFSIKNNNLEAVKLLVENGANINDLKSIGPALIYACSYGFFEIIEFLINNKTKLKVLDSDKNNLLMIASKEGYLKIVKYLIKKEIDINQVNKFGNNALMFAIMSNNIDIVNELIKNGIDINAYNKEGATALMVAVQYKRYHIIEKLLSINTTDVNKIDYDGYTALMYACLIEDIKSVAFLLDNKKTNINKSNHNNETALMISIKKNNEEITTLLLAKMADVNIKNIKGENALKIAALNGNYDLAKIILNYSDIDYKFYDKDLMNSFKKMVLENEKNSLINKNWNNNEEIKSNLANLEIIENNKIYEKIKNISDEIVLDLVDDNTKLINDNADEFYLEINNNNNNFENDDKSIIETTHDSKLNDFEINDQRKIMENIDDSIINIFNSINNEKNLKNDFDQTWLDLHIQEQNEILNNAQLSIIEKMELWIQFVQKTKVEWSPNDRFKENELIIIENNNLPINEEKYRNKIFSYWEKIKK